MRSIAVIVMLLMLVAGAAQAAPEGNGVEAALSLGTGSSHWLEGEATLGWRFLPSLVVSGRASATIIDDRDAATDLGVAVRLRGPGSLDGLYLEAQLARLYISTEYDCLGPTPTNPDLRCVGGDATGVAGGLVGGFQVARGDHVSLDVRIGVIVFHWRDHSTQAREDEALARVGLGLSFY
jgi:hypothetical protein